LITAEHQGVLIKYVIINSRDLKEVRDVRFVSNSAACDWLTDQWPVIKKNRAWIESIDTNVPVYYPNSSVTFKDTPHV
jgi:hypothetical protein